MGSADDMDDDMDVGIDGAIIMVGEFDVAVSLIDTTREREKERTITKQFGQSVSDLKLTSSTHFLPSL